MPRRRPHTSWLRQVESYLEDTGMTGYGGRRSTVGRWTRRLAAPAYAPIPTYLDFIYFVYSRSHQLLNSQISGMVQYMHNALSSGR